MKIHTYLRVTYYLAGVLGFEPRNDGIKTRCLKPNLATLQ